MHDKKLITKALIIQHEEDTPPGSVVDWLQKHQIHFEIIFFSKTSIIQDDYDFYIVCGGGMNVDEEHLYPWLVDEKKFIRNLIKNNKKVLGLCLGAQLLSEALGGSVFKAQVWEIGWQLVHLHPNLKALTVFQWHGYQFTTPPRGICLASSSHCPHQAFSFDDHILAFQFHPEATSEWVRDCAGDPKLPDVSETVQTKDEMLQGMHHQRNMQEWFFSELDSFFMARKR